MRVSEVESRVYELEEVRIVIRADSNEEVGTFNYSRKAPGTASITEWLDQRIYPLVGNHGVVVIDGNGATPHRRTRMSTLRESYER
jgi:hypothetical protein